MEAIRDFVKGLTAEEEEPPPPRQPRPTSSKVVLHVYDFLEQGLNGMLRQVGTGGFHCGVEVYGKEWSFRRSMIGTGIYWYPPKSCTAHKYRESVAMGKINLSEDKFLQLVHRLKKDWPGSGYDILRRNCCIFSDHLCQKLGLGPIPDWITNLAGVGADLRSVVRRPLRQMEEAVFGEEPQPEQRPPGPKSSPSQQGRSSQMPGGRPSSSLQGRPVSHRDGYEKLEQPVRPKTARESLRQSLRTYGPGAVLVAMFLGLCALAGAAGAGRLPRLAWPWRRPPARGKVQWRQPSPLPTVLPTAIPQPMLSFDCDRGFDTWVVSWSLKQSSWCCKHAGRGCPGFNSSAFSCKVRGTEGFETWSPYELEWCCLHRRIGCHRLAKFVSSSDDGVSSRRGANGATAIGSLGGIGGVRGVSTTTKGDSGSGSSTVSDGRGSSSAVSDSSGSSATVSGGSDDSSTASSSSSGMVGSGHHASNGTSGTSRASGGFTLGIGVGKGVPHATGNSPGRNASTDSAGHASNSSASAGLGGSTPSPEATFTTTVAAKPLVIDDPASIPPPPTALGAALAAGDESTYLALKNASRAELKVKDGQAVSLDQEDDGQGERPSKHRLRGAAGDAAAGREGRSGGTDGPGGGTGNSSAAAATAGGG